MRQSSFRIRWLLILLGLLMPALLLAGGTAWSPCVTGVAFAGDEEEGEDPLEDDDEDDFFDSPTSFSPEQAGQAILKGVSYLKKVQEDNGSWGDITGGVPYGGGQAQGQAYTHPAGATALALYALLKCKVPLKDPAVRKGFDFLRKRHDEPGGSYETSALLLAVCATANPYKTTTASRKRVERLKLKGPWRSWAQKLQKYLVSKRAAQGWRYNLKGSQGEGHGGNQDLSSTQLAALALFAAHQVKIRTSNDVWTDILEFSMEQQDTEGPEVVTKDPLTGAEIRRQSRGFAYVKGLADPGEGKATGSMTACGIANIMMARYVLTDAGREREAFAQRFDAKKIQRSIEDGLCWLEENWHPYANPRKVQGNIYHLYWLYSVERTMDLVGHQRIGSHFWYSEMGQQLINNQKEDGSWDTKSTLDPRPTLDTCFALLFLKKATEGQIPFPSVTGGSDEPPVDNR